jgi:hypothetical protein
MHVDKAKKRIAKQVKKGLKGYPIISLAYFGTDEQCATEVVISFTLEEGAQAQEERFVSKTDVREDEVIQTTLVKIIDRANAGSVVEVAGTSII